MQWYLLVDDLAWITQNMICTPLPRTQLDSCNVVWYMTVPTLPCLPLDLYNVGWQSCRKLGSYSIYKICITNPKICTIFRKSVVRIHGFVQHSEKFRKSVVWIHGFVQHSEKFRKSVVWIHGFVQRLYSNTSYNFVSYNIVSYNVVLYTVDNSSTLYEFTSYNIDVVRGTTVVGRKSNIQTNNIDASCLCKDMFVNPFVLISYTVLKIHMKFNLWAIQVWFLQITTFMHVRPSYSFQSIQGQTCHGCTIMT